MNADGGGQVFHHAGEEAAEKGGPEGGGGKAGGGGLEGMPAATGHGSQVTSGGSATAVGWTASTVFLSSRRDAENGPRVTRHARPCSSRQQQNNSTFRDATSRFPPFFPWPAGCFVLTIRRISGTMPCVRLRQGEQPETVTQYRERKRIAVPVCPKRRHGFGVQG
jgi:hypothetical protein